MPLNAVLMSWGFMGIKQVDRLYKKMMRMQAAKGPLEVLSPLVRSEIFEKIMDDVERLLQRRNRCRLDSSNYQEFDDEIRKLLLKEIQVIIDDYVFARQNGTLDQWKAMYGTLEQYKRSFYLYRQSGTAFLDKAVDRNYGFFSIEE